MENLAYKNNNVVGLNINNLYSYIQLFLNSKAKNTKRSYSSSIDNFFMYMVNKHINEVTWEDITDKTVFNIANIDKYFSFLKNDKRDRKGNKLANKTINTYRNSIISLFETLSGYGEELGYNVNDNIFVNVKRLSEKENHWGEMSDEEIWNLIEYAKTEYYEGEAKSVFFETLFVTGLRKSVTLKLTYDNITQRYHRKNKMNFWQVDIFDKGKELSFPIPDRLYNKLLSIKKPDSNDVFNFGELEARNTFDRYCREHKIDKYKRNLSLHSIKHTGVLNILEKTGNDVEIAKNYAHHSKTQTTFNYTNKNIDLFNNPIYNFYDEVDMSILENMPQEQLIDMIKKSPIYIQKELINIANNNK